MASNTAQHHFSQATKLHQQNKFAKAQFHYEKVLKQQPKHSDSWHLLGLVKAELGKIESGLKDIKRAIELAPQNPIFRINEGLLYRRCNRWEDEIQSYQMALKLDPNNLHATLNLADALSEKKESELAIPLYQKVVTSEPNAYKAWHNLGNAYLATRAFESALSAYDRALELCPQQVETLNNKGIVYYEMNQLQPAIQLYQLALQLNPDYVSAYINLGSAYAKMGEWEKAETAFRQAVHIQPKNAETYNSWGNCYKQQNRANEAQKCFETAVQIHPNFHEAEFNLAITELLLGDFSNGWRHYESRHQLREHKKVDYHLPHPFWQGESLKGEQLFIITEQGLGDVIQFSRFIPLLQERAEPKNIIFECQPPLIPLLQASFPDITIVPRGQIPEQFDKQVRLMSLPLYLGLQPETISLASGYVFAPEGEIPQVLSQKSTARRIGLVWGGNPGNPNDENRSIPLEYLKPLFDIPGTEWFSLQMGEREKEIPDHHLEEKLINLAPSIQNFTDTARIMKSLDLVITVDTAVAHLAGAINRPGWVLLPFAPDFRWLLDRSDTPWYTSLKLFRQPKPKDWGGVVEQLQTALSNQ